MSERGAVDGAKDFQEKLRRLGTLVGDLDQLPGGGSKAATREMIQLLMEIHGAGLERMMEIVFETGGATLVDRLGEDPIVRHLLLLYSLHPEDLESRVAKAIDTAKTRLRKFDAQVELTGMQDGDVTLRLKTSAHACGSTAKNLKAIIEECLYEQAPDVTSLTIVVPSEESTGFVPIGSLIKHAADAHTGVRVDVESAD